MAGRTRSGRLAGQLELVADENAASSSGADAPSQTAPLMTAQEVAQVLRVPRSTVYELARNRRIPFVKVGRRTLFVRQALLDWIASELVQPRR